MNKSFISLTLLLAVMAETSHADRAQANLAAGLSRHSEQRNTRSVDVSADKTAGTLTKTVNTAGPRETATTTTQISRSKEADTSVE